MVKMKCLISEPYTSINLNEITNDGANEANFRVISYTCVKAATNNFPLENKLGEGGFGPVYKVTSK